ncbi:hypothetical protein AADR41_07020 [Streptomyces sp. CLV115]|uniref:hypothetical protein n=1 Tax=Streptomyces sp. CLV115 TaxID=3138502 RepID=UPI00313AFB29
MSTDLITAVANQELSDLDLDIKFLASDESADFTLTCAVDSMGNNVNTSMGIRGPICCA